jgi:predicted acylesterase/phospholipase RssA
MGVGLFLAGGAPNLAFMAGALTALDERNVKFEFISTTGAGMLIGLLDAASKGDGDLKTLRREALKNTVNMSIDDTLYRWLDTLGLETDFKVFHKKGELAELYTKFFQNLPWPTPTPQTRFFLDWARLWLGLFCPTDLSLLSKGFCQPAPFINEVIDFSKLKIFESDFYLSAYCIENMSIEVFEKNDITSEHFHAALAMPLIYEPKKLNGKTYIEGSAVDTIAFEKILPIYFDIRDEGTDQYYYVPKPDRPLISRVLVFDILGKEQLIREPRNLLDALSQAIITPLVPLARDDIKLFDKNYRPRYKLASTGAAELQMTEISLDLRSHAEWNTVLDWSYSNAERLFDLGYKSVEQKYNSDPLQFQ